MLCFFFLWRRQHTNAIAHSKATPTPAPTPAPIPILAPEERPLLPLVPCVGETDELVLLGVPSVVPEVWVGMLLELVDPVTSAKETLKLAGFNKFTAGFHI